MISVCRAKRKSGSWSHPNSAVPTTACKPLSSVSKVTNRSFGSHPVEGYLTICSIRIDAGYGEKVLFAAVDEEAADENESSKIEDEVCPQRMSSGALYGLSVSRSNVLHGTQPKPTWIPSRASVGFSCVASLTQRGAVKVSPTSACPTSRMLAFVSSPGSCQRNDRSSS